MRPNKRGWAVWSWLLLALLLGSCQLLEDEFSVMDRAAPKSVGPARTASQATIVDRP